MRAASLVSLFFFFVGLIFAEPAPTDPPSTTDTWQNDEAEADSTLEWSDTENWEDAAVPANDGTAVVAFPGVVIQDQDEVDPISVGLDLTSIDLLGLRFGEQPWYSFSNASFDEGMIITIRDFIAVAGGEYSSEILFESDVVVRFIGNVEIDLGSGVDLEIKGGARLESGNSLLKTGSGTLVLSQRNNSNSGTINVEEGFLGLGDDQAAGTSPISIGDEHNPGSNTAGLIAVDGNRNIDNAITIHGLFQTEEDDHDDHELNLEGDVTLTANTRINNFGGLLNFMGDITESTAGVKVTVNADEPVLFTGSAGFTGGLEVERGAVIFTDLNALPAGPSGTAFTTTDDWGYIGLMIESSTDRATAMTNFLALFDPHGFGGIIGFDTDPGTTGINDYAGNIDLSLFSDARIGSVTTAQLSGTITPYGTNYRFGGGGGTLVISSLLQDPEIFAASSKIPGPVVAAVTELPPRGIDVKSDLDNPLTVFINNSANSFSGTVTAEHSAIIFGNAPGALPTDALLQPGEGGYIGLQDTTRSISSYLAQFDSGLEQGIIGFDSSDRDTNRVINDNIDLSGFSATKPEFYLGTATWVNLGGTISLPDNADAYRFAGFKGGALNVTSTLTDGESPLGVVIGDKDSDATHGYEAPASEEFDHSSVRLEGTNTYTGGTSLQAGELIVTNNASIGTGDLTVEGKEGEGGFVELLNNRDDYGDVEIIGPILRPDTSDLTLSNVIDLQSFLEIVVETGLTDRNLTLSGNISGSGGINKTGSGTLNLSGDNSEFDGGLYLSEGTVNILGDTSAGSGPVGFGSDAFKDLVFQSANPTIGGLYEIDDEEDGGYYSYSYSTVQINSGSTLTLDLNGNDLEFGGSINGAGGLRISGEGTQRFSNTNSFAGGLEIANGGNLIVSDRNSLGEGALQPPAVTLDGGSLTLDGDPEDSSNAIRGNITFGSEGGEIRGNGRLSFTNDLEIGDGASISPGESIGRLDFAGTVNFGELGSLSVEIGDGENYNEIIHDVMYANAINLTATSANPFSINISGENGNVPENFDVMQAYSWSVVLAHEEITSFDALYFDLNVSKGLTDLTEGGTWALGIGSSGNDLGETFLTNNVIVVSFTPIPEPATFTLLALGLGLIGFRRPGRRASSR